MIECAEMSGEFSWKPWAADAPFINRDALIEEIVDVNHFLGFMLVVLGVSDEEYEAAYRRKQAINKARQEQAGGYTVRTKGAYIP